MPQSPTALSAISPFFIVGNLARAVGFYQRYLGFEVRFIAPDDNPFFALIGRDSVELLLKEVDAPVQPLPNHTRSEYASWDAFVTVADPDALAAEFLAKGLTLHSPLGDRPDDGLRGFEVRDSEGYVLYFGRTQAPAA